MVELILVFLVPVGVVVSFLLSPVWITHLTIKENKYFRFDRLHRLKSIKNRDDGKQLFWAIKRSGGLYFGPILFSVFLFSYVDTQEVIYLVVGLLELILITYICFHETYLIYKRFKGYRKITHLFWGLNSLLVVMNFFAGVSLIIMIINLVLMLVWMKKTERALLYSKKLDLTK
ncbi:hypothetical protein [Vibrio sp. 99-70-13A1]|uniref:hypothetical protein n=1 Tax=Vibrio sp. 99-70-13A1 TaxID=2607601 RepID=UPI0014933285|nr:hypothetical protein [Vibrio sp. 99-70-13A1]NOH99417.1 hypothetical protein [Vibrio sp. 99-70-13A1]